VEADESRLLILVEMTADGVAHLLAQAVDVVGFRKDGSAERARRITTLRRVFYEKN
jgi:hypothetical protein